MKPKTQSEAIKKALANGVKLSSLNSFKEVGCMRLGARMFDLIEAGWKIKKEWKQIKTRFGTHCRYMEYSLDLKRTPKKLVEQFIDEYKYFKKLNENQYECR